MAQSNAPTIRHYDYAALIRELWGEGWGKPDVAYEFSNDRKYDDSGAHSGIYED